MGCKYASIVKPLDFLMAMRERHGDVFPIRLVGGERLLVVGDPDLAEQVFRAPADVLHAGEANRRALGPLLGEHSLILLDGERHRSHRRLLLPPLHGEALRGRAEAIRRLADERLREWPLGEEVEVLPRARALALEAVLHVAFGDSAEDALASLREALAGLRLPASPRVAGRPEFRRSVQAAAARLATEVARRRDRPAAGEGGDVLALLLEARLDDGSPLSDEEVRDELMTLVVAGSETTAASLAWALERLSRSPDALARVSADARRGGGPYLDAAIHETLRVRPAVPMSARQVKRPFVLGERTVPPGETIAVSSLLIHHRDDVYPDPLAFRPERFEGRRPTAYAWIPFGGGGRRCIGAAFALMEMRIALSALLSRVSLQPTRMESEPMATRANTLVPARGARVTLGPAKSGT